ncbi:DUF2093 domain-containing protein [Novosphingobium flavum]|uniref:DUF2093 domain-containing protein n=1 Tax=Novosphingobium flavum TaxID=1778672 RepID=A0A7X1FPQ1_9SPHN|nr:DUF2093 domain-containing protein [Novosphingobium flavum]MBC2664598.1 DUF2093 domain-containing protein [Novosphingobium flavum]
MLMKNASDRPATLHFEANGFRVITHGSHVICAVSGKAISLEELRYWSVTRQEAYASPELATQRLLGKA